MNIPPRLRRLVIQRADDRCEYCGLSQVGQEAQFHLDHIIPVTAGGGTAENNLALACVSCSLRKGARQACLDPNTRESFPIFNPRRERWNDHFRWEGVLIVGKTPAGRATVSALLMNRPLICAIRHEEALRERHPPPQR